MQAVRLILYQNMVNYRREMSFGYVQSYPLPTPSMVKGMAHALLGLTKFHPLSISIQGNFDTIVTNMQKVIKFDRYPRYPVPVQVGKRKQSINYGVQFVDEIVNMNLVLHIRFEEEELNQRLHEAVIRNTLALGRNEDIAFVDFDKSKLVDIETFQADDDIALHNCFYLNHAFAKRNNISGTRYRLPFYYKPVKNITDKRIFSFVDVVFASSTARVNEDETFQADLDGNIIQFLTVKAP